MLYYCQPDEITDTSATLSREEAHHLLHVRRAEQSDTIRFTDGIGCIYTGVIHSLSSKKAEIEITSQTEQTEVAPELTIGFAIPKSKRIDILIEKGTELGVKHFIPIKFTRASVDLRPGSGKWKRMERIVVSASKQSERALFPTIHPPAKLDSILSESDTDTKILFGSQHNSTSITDALTENPTQNIIALIGPEGGYTQDETQQMTEQGAVAVALAPYTLRIETAVITMASLIKCPGKQSAQNKT